MFEWFHPLYLADKASGFKTNKFVEVSDTPYVCITIVNHTIGLHSQQYQIFDVLGSLFAVHCRARHGGDVPGPLSSEPKTCHQIVLWWPPGGLLDNF